MVTIRLYVSVAKSLFHLEHNSIICMIEIQTKQGNISVKTVVSTMCRRLYLDNLPKVRIVFRYSGQLIIVP